MNGRKGKLMNMQARVILAVVMLAPAAGFCAPVTGAQALAANPVRDGLSILWKFAS